MTDILKDVVSVTCCQIYLITTDFPISIHIFHPKYGRYSPLTCNNANNVSEYHLTHLRNCHIERLNVSQKTCCIMICTLIGGHRQKYDKNMTKKG